VKLRLNNKTTLLRRTLHGMVALSLVAGLLFYFHSLKAEGSARKASSNVGDTIEFSGYKWLTKDSDNRQTGPGDNYFSGSKDNVYVDDEGRLHLRVTNRNDKWYCPEVRLIGNLGYGRYYFYLEPLPQPLDKDIVIGMFTYDREDTSHYHKEIDIELSTWGKDSALNTQYVIQPKEDEAFRFDTDLSLPTKHLIELRKHKVTFRSFYEAIGPDDIPLKISEHKQKPEYTYNSDSEQICINVWLFRTSEPSNLKEFEVIVKRFEYKRLKFLGIFPL